MWKHSKINLNLDEDADYEIIGDESQNINASNITKSPHFIKKISLKEYKELLAESEKYQELAQTLKRKEDELQKLKEKSMIDTNNLAKETPLKREDAHFVEITEKILNSDGTVGSDYKLK